MSRGPLPSQLCLLSELPAREVNDKVRFLGCVLGYSKQKAQLELRHPHPEGADTVKAMVDINLMLDSVSHEQTAVGSWLNIIGYIKAKRKKASKPRAKDGADGGAVSWDVLVQAIMLWPTGPLDVQQYENAFPGPAQNNSKP